MVLTYDTAHMTNLYGSGCLSRIAVLGVCEKQGIKRALSMSAYTGKQA